MDAHALTLLAPRGSLSDASGACTGASAVVLAANVNRKFLLIQNISDEAIHFNLGAAATTNSNSVKLDAGAGYDFPRFIPTDALYIIGTSGKKFVVKHA